MKFIATSYLIYVRLKIRRNVQSVNKTTNCLRQISWWKKWEKFSSKLCQRLEKQRESSWIIALGVVLFFLSFENLRISRNCYLANSSPRRFHFKRLLLQAISGWWPLRSLPSYSSNSSCVLTSNISVQVSQEVPFVRRKQKAGVQQRVKRAGSLWSG